MVRMQLQRRPRSRPAALQPLCAGDPRDPGLAESTDELLHRIDTALAEPTG